MGRSKFPGKPPKTVTRKRIKVLGQPETVQADPVSVAENIYYGLSLFNETFGDNEKEHPPFHGFSTKEANLSVSYIKTTQQHDPENAANESPSTAAAAETSVRQGSAQQTVKDSGNSCSDGKKEAEQLCDKNFKPAEDVKKETSPSNGKQAPKIHRAKSRRSCKNIKFTNFMKAPVLKSVNNILDQHQRTRQLRNSTAKRLLQRAKSSGSSNSRNMTVQSGDKSNAVRKFVLPVRSAHSSRVIKPNKRFIEELEEISGAEHSENEITSGGGHVKKPKFSMNKFTNNQESKLKEAAANKFSVKLRDKETRNRARRSVTSVVASSTVRITTGKVDKPETIVQDAQASKAPVAKDTKRSPNVPGAKIKPEATAVSNDTPNNTQEYPQQCVTRAAQAAKSSFSRGQRQQHQQISVPTKVLPDTDVPNSESSRIQTRSGTQVAVEVLAEQKTVQTEDCPRLTEDNNNKRREDHSQTMCKTAATTTTAAAAAATAGAAAAAAAGDGCSDNFDTESTLSESGSEHSNHTEDEQSEWTGMKLNGGKVILRKARLKLDNKCVGGTEGPFSTTNTGSTATGNNNLGLTGTIKCGVCGAVRFYRFVKQARKFGIHSCESCRKFISKMIKRQACAKSTNSTLPILQCHKGDGLCLVPPVVRSQQWNLMRCVYKARCPACWLKMCLKCYNIPTALRTGLNALLPPMMRDPLCIPLTLGHEENDTQAHKLTSCKLASWPAEESSEKNLFKSAMSWRGIELGQKTPYQGTAGFMYTKLDKFDSTMSISPSKKRRKNNRIKVRKKMKNPMFSPPTLNQCPPPLRQRLELKGPRVKHVCRSASVALGQPIATFPVLEGKEDKNIPKPAKEPERTEKRDETKEKEPSKVEGTATSAPVTTIQQTHSRRAKPQQTNASANLPAVSKPVSETLHTVSIDFWEQYDPNEVGTKGFALIGSELFHIPAICYLCGSAGKEPLIHCQCCCEPYHAFCLEPSEWNACAQPNWCCPRCTVCQSCHLRSGPKLSCIRCRQSFHHSCLSKSGVSARLYSPDRPYVCQSCIKCKSCGSEGVNVHVGNLPLCSMCFKLRQQGNYCPLCQRCYNENDYDTKMMECSECSCWVHARCEGLSDERYQILSYLPDSIEFTCSQCSSNSNSVWRNAIEAELKAGFIGVIKSLSKNRKACAALKWSPRKECLCRPVSSVRKLDFSDERSDQTTGNKDSHGDDLDEGNSERSSSEFSSSNGTSKSEMEDQSTENSSRRGLRRLRQKFHLKECSVRVKNCVPKDSQDQKDSTGQDTQSGTNDTECHCSEQQIIMRPSPTLMSVKRKVNGNEYRTLAQFHCDMEHVINRAGTRELIEAYQKILQEVFPWFTPRSCKSANGKNEMLTPTKETGKEPGTPTKFDDSILEVWREEVMRAPKAIAAKTANLYNVNTEDSRSCCLCKGLGDGQETKEGRLLYCGQNEWVHSNCALWSNEVFEEIDGSLQNVHSAISRGRLIRCTECGKKGASVGCCAKNCSNTFHYPCARTVGLAFNDDKTVFCSLHLNNCTHKTLQNETEFSLKRPVYVELDRKKKKYAEPNKVKVMIGSLMIDCLGTVIPEFSDTVERIIPCEYKCSRLYWSTINPFKIVRYYIRTYVQVYVPEVSPDMENNVTIDHSKEQERKDLLDMQRIEYLAVRQTLDALIDSVCNREADENLAEQNNTDLLPPELKEAIFEDLPHDLLDGISMQDIFPKMTYEDFLAMDLKNDGTFAADLFKDDMLAPEVVEDIAKPPESKISKVDPSLLELGPHNDLWVHLETKTTVQDLMDDLFSSKNQKRGGRELKRSKSEVMANNPLIVGGQRHHQRSCSLTWSCKLDNSYGPSMKRRKLPRNSSMNKTNETGLMVLDTPGERASMLHELRIPESIMVTVGRANTPNIITDSVRELKYCIEDTNGINRRVLSTGREDTKEHKRLFWHARQQPRILQVDGPADPNSASECSSPEYNVEDKTAPRVPPAEGSSIPQLDGINDESSCDSNEFNEKNTSGERASGFLRPKRIYGFIRSQIAEDKPTRTVNEGSPRTTVSRPGKDAGLKLEIPQLDGADDVSSDDECVSPGHGESERTTTTNQLVPAYEAPFDHIDRPVTCKRCRCTYRTQDSYNRHLSNCDIMITSDSDSETMDNKLASPDSRFSPSIGSVSPQFITLSPSEGHTLTSDYPDMQATSPLEASVPSPHPAIQIEPIAQAIITPQIHTHATVETVHQTVLTSNDMIVQTQYTRTTTTLPNATVLPQESTVQITEITDPPSVASDSSITTRNVVNTPMSSPDSASPRTVPSPEVSPTFSSTGVQTAGNDSAAQPNVQAAKMNKSKSPRAPKSRSKGIKSQVVKNNNNAQPHNNGHARFQPVQNNAPVIQLQQTQRPSGPTVILQQVASPGIMSAYVETLQQQSGQNLQYITAIGGQHDTAGFKPQFITTNHLVPGAYIQTPSDNLLTLQNGGISILPGVQIAQTQPTVLGTIIQQQPSAIQCGVISSEQLLLSSTPTLEMFTDSTGSMFLSNQPMYYGLETIVSNTVMSSSQFMAGAVPQVLASSYQTTTQVFQASKLMEPIVDVQAVPGVPTVTAVQTVQNMPGVPGVTGVAGMANVPGVPSATANVPPGVPNVASVPSATNVPNVPTVPAVPTVSNVAGLSGVPGVPNVPGTPGMPNATGIQSVPSVASMPTVSSVANVSTVSSMPSVQNIPGVPGVPNVPGLPNMPGLPNLPNVSNVQSVPSGGNLLNLPTVPNVAISSVSSVPTTPVSLTMPGIPSVPGVTSVASVQNASSIPGIQTVPTVASISNAPSIQNGLPGVPNAISAVTSLPSIPTVPSIPPSQPNVSTIPGIPNVPNIPSVSTVANLPNVSHVPNLPTQSTCSVANVRASLPPGYVVVNQSNVPIPEPIAKPSMNISTSAEQQRFAPSTCNPIAPPCLVEPAVSIQGRSTIGCMQESQNAASPIVTAAAKLPTIPSIPRVAVRPSPASHSVGQMNNNNNGPWKLTEPLFGTEQLMNNGVRPYFDSKHVSENTSMIKSSISSKISPLPNHCITQRNIIVNKMSHDVNNVHNSYNASVPCANSVSVSVCNNHPVITSSSMQNKITMSSSNLPQTNRPMNRVLPMQAVTPKQDLARSVQKTDIVMEEPTKPVIKPAEPETEVRGPKKQMVEAVGPVKKPETTINNIGESLKLNTETIEKVKENLKLELDKEKLQSNASLKIVLQKQLQDGSYKITHNMKAAVAQSKKQPPQVTSVEILPSKQVPQIASLQLLPIKTFTLKTNKVDEKAKPTVENKLNGLKTKTPPVAVKKPRVVSKSIRSNAQTSPPPPNARMQKSCAKGPTLMYEIKSQDGFTHTATSMAEVWETVFQAVQNARKAHNLPPLPHNPLSENLGLENNATVYLVEQLPGVNRCTKYKPRFHDLPPPKPGETENDLPTACDNGAARAEPFKGRKVHDMFSWLASRHRQQPKMIAISEAESRRVASTNLPMAMRFRILKETSKESVGVYHSHIHGRGLFCLRDIEAGEMVIEYAGEVIRASLTDKREKYYDSKNIGCYMFKIDDHLVVDATMKGNAARFINHSCEPNCYSRVVDILGKKHILIFALRRITQGEELTYDYKFPFEDIKIPCTCGSRRCRKYLN